MTPEGKAPDGKAIEGILTYPVGYRAGTRAPLLVVGPGTRTGIPVRTDDPREVGPDRVVNAVGVHQTNQALD